MSVSDAYRWHVLQFCHVVGTVSIKLHGTPAAMRTAA